jgi:hypothetical protein
MAGFRDPQGKERTPRSFWFDPRFAIGIGLVIVSVVGVYGIVTATDRTVQVFSSSSALSPGDRIYADDLVSESVRLGDLGGKYLTPEELSPDGLVVTRAVAAGELIPTSALGSAASIRVASVVVTVSGQLSKSIEPGTVVDVWSAAQTDHGVFGPPTVLVGSATVVRTIESSGLIAGTGSGVEILIPREKVARALEAVANGDAISLVPVSLPVRR